MKRKIITSSLVALFSYGLVGSTPALGQLGGPRGCPDCGPSPPSFSRYEGFISSPSYSSIVQDPRTRWDRGLDIEEIARVFGIEPESYVFVGSDSDVAEIKNPIDYVSSLYDEVIWNNRREGFVAFKERNNKLEYFGGTLMPISSENNTELAGNYIQFVEDNINMERLIWCEKDKFVSKGRIVKILREKSGPHIIKLKYDDTDFYIEQISKSTSTYMPTNDFFYVSYDHGNVTMGYTKNTLEDKLPITNDQSIR